MLRAEPYSETARKLVHMAFGAAALLLRYIDWWQAVVFMAAALAFNILLLRGLSGGRLHRPRELTQALPPGLVLYPASLLFLLLVFPARPDIVAAAWGILAIGDGAATLVGRRIAGRHWPWNGEKTIAGSLALFLAGGAAGAFLAWWCRPAVVPPPAAWFSVAAPFAAALGAALAETVRWELDDNVSVPLTAAAVLWILSFLSVAGTGT